MSPLGLLCFLYGLSTYGSTPGSAPYYITPHYTSTHGTCLECPVFLSNESYFSKHFWKLTSAFDSYFSIDAPVILSCLLDQILTCSSSMFPSELPGKWGRAGWDVGAWQEDSLGGRTQSDAQPSSPLSVRNQWTGLLCSFLHNINLKAGFEPAGSYRYQRWPVWPDRYAADPRQYCGHSVKLCRQQFRSIRIFIIHLRQLCVTKS